MRSDCPNGCDWTNIYSTCQDGSRELAVYMHVTDECSLRLHDVDGE